MSRDPQVSPKYGCQLTDAQRKVLADLRPDLAERLKLEERGGRKILLTREELTSIRDMARARMTQAASGMIRNSLRHLADAAERTLEDSQGIGAIPRGRRIYQFRVSLETPKRIIWRRFQTRSCSLDRLHAYIQTAMGWTNSHLHEFWISEEQYGDPMLLDVAEPFTGHDSLETKIEAIVPEDGSRFRFAYHYDFGDDWRHEVLFEGCLGAEAGQRYPICLEGEYACPPEDVGGVQSYERYLEALADRDHPEHRYFYDWRGRFDPNAFDAEATTKAMRRGLPAWR
ncbi:MAG: plasmid pRiA4b ORF-3 family protein [Planctomycetota bacterium]